MSRDTFQSNILLNACFLLVTGLTAIFAMYRFYMVQGEAPKLFAAQFAIREIPEELERILKASPEEGQELLKKLRQKLTERRDALQKLQFNLKVVREWTANLDAALQRLPVKQVDFTDASALLDWSKGPLQDVCTLLQEKTIATRQTNALRLFGVITLMLTAGLFTSVKAIHAIHTSYTQPLQRLTSDLADIVFSKTPDQRLYAKNAPQLERLAELCNALLDQQARFNDIRLAYEAKGTKAIHLALSAFPEPTLLLAGNGDVFMENAPAHALFHGVDGDRLMVAFKDALLKDETQFSFKNSRYDIRFPAKRQDRSLLFISQVIPHRG